MKKQVILLMTDTTRKDMLGCYGNPDMKTPNLDRLAEEGIKYDNAYTCQPVCGPARSTIFTGTMPHSNGMIANCLPLYEDSMTIGQILSDSGISCGYVGKWHLDGGDYFGNGVCPPGWNPNYWYDMRCYLNELSEEERVKSRKGSTSFDASWGEEMTYAHRCSDRGISFLKEFADQDFFLTVSYDEPHGPSVCPAPFNTMYDGYSFPDNPTFSDPLINKPLMQRLWAGDNLMKSPSEVNHATKEMSLFLGCNSFADYEIGRVLKAIDEFAPNAMVIYTSDHGDMLGAHRLQQKNSAIYNEVANIPLLIKGGERGKTVKYPASHLDLVPTILDYMGVSIPVSLQGKSMLPQIYDTAKRINSVVYTEFTRYEVDHDGFGGLQPMRAIVSDRYKLAIHLLDTDEFYDLQTDPYEMNNLINDESFSAVRNQLHDQLLEWMNDTRDVFRGYQWSARPWRTDKHPVWANDGYTRQRDNDPGEIRQLDYDTGLPMVSAVRKKGPAIW